MMMVLVAVSACGLSDGDRYDGEDFFHTGCASETKAGLNGAASELILEHTPKGLMVTRKNAEMNCAIKLDGIECEANVEGDAIGYYVHPKSEMSANCVCLVKEMLSTVTGLTEGNEYTLYYWCEGEGPLVPISFTYAKGFRMVIDPDLFQAEIVDIGDGTWRPNVPYWWK